jgi:PAS domain S-box-containing protein
MWAGSKPSLMVRWAQVLVVAVLYCGTARLGHLLAIPPGTVTPFWPPSGIALAAVLLCGYRVLPGVALGAFVATVWSLAIEAPDHSAAVYLACGVGVGVGATLQAFVAPALLRHLVQGRHPLDRTSDVFRFVVIAGLVGCTISPTIGTTTLWLAKPFPVHWRVLCWLWWVGDAIGVLILAPVALAWARYRWAAGEGRRLIEAFVILSLMAGVGWIVYFGWPAEGEAHNPLSYLLIPCLVWVVFRLGQPWAATAVLAAAGIAIWGTMQGTGPLATRDYRVESLVLLQVFLGVISTLTLTLAAVVTERKTAVSELQQLNETLEQRVAERSAAAERHAAELAKADEALAKERDLLRTLIDQMPDYIFIKDAQSRMVLSNAAHIDALGARTLEEIVGKTDFDFLAPELAAQYYADEQAIVRSGQALVNRVEQVIDHAGRRKWVLTIKVPLCDSRGQVVRLVGISRDITTIKEAEEALVHAKEAAEAANRAKSEFLATMSHEIRTPMNGILGMTELALDTELAPEQREYLAMVKVSTEALLAVINDILDFSKIEARMLQLDAVDFNLYDLLGHTMKAMALRAQQKGLELVCHIGNGVPQAVVGDPIRLRQILVNLIGNAIKFTEQGEVIVHVEPAEATDGNQGRSEGRGARGEGSECLVPSSPRPQPTSTLAPRPSVSLHFAVSDTGIGIPPDKQRQIFEAFAQADSSTTRKYGGTGLGLSISSQLVELMGGHIQVASTVGQGSRFHFSVPFGLGEVAPRPSSVVPHSENMARLEGLPVLVVDDNATNRRILQEMLANWRMRPQVEAGAPSALSALERAAAAGTPFPLVILDAHMPDMDGFSLAERIRRVPALQDTTIIMLTSAGQPRDITRCRELGIDAYLMKPATQSELLDTILTALHGPVRPGPRPRGTPMSVGVPPGRPLQVLLVEDNSVNQLLVVTLLEKQGHRVVVAGNGKEALTVLEQRANASRSQQPAVDLVLMDVMMPEMDGLQATAAIRDSEQGTGRHVPIVAMTAHVVTGDRERCLEAGMDDYVAKPIQAGDLQRVLERFFPAVRAFGYDVAANEPVAQGANATCSGPELRLDKAALLTRLGGREDRMRKIVQVFLKEASQLMTEIQEAIRCGDAGRLKRPAHSLKGAVGIFGAPGVTEAAQQLEAMGQAGDMAAAGEAYAALEEALERLKPILVPLADPESEAQTDYIGSR